MRSWFPRALIFRLSLLGALLLTWFSPRSAYAYSWMLKHGYGGCPTCHTDPSGGELLTPYGRAQSDLLLRMRYGSDNSSAQASRHEKSSGSFDSFDSFDANEDDSKEGDDSADKPDKAGQEEKSKSARDGEPASGKPASDEGGGLEDAPNQSSQFLWGLVGLPDWLLLSGSYRQLTVYDLPAGTIKGFPMQVDAYGQLGFGALRLGGSIGLARVPEGSPYARAAQITRNQGNQMNLISRTHYLGYELANGAVLVRAGRLNLPFGVRIPEHTMWVRSATRTDRESGQEHGLAVAFNGESVRGEVMAIAGNYQVHPSRFRERGYSLYFEYLIAPRTGVGVSSFVTSAERDRVIPEPGRMLRQAHGLFTRATLTDSVVLLAELDALKRSFADLGYVGFAQLDWEAVQGLHLMATGEVLDAGYEQSANPQRVPGAGRPQLGGWGSLDWFFLPHCELRLDAVERQNGDFTMLGQFHVFF